MTPIIATGSFPIEVWEPNPDRPGMLRYTSNRSFVDVSNAVNTLLDDHGFDCHWVTNSEKYTKECIPDTFPGFRLPRSRR